MFDSPPCPRCFARAIPILYGLPEPPIQVLYEHGLVALGGGPPGADPPIWCCPHCQFEWGGIAGAEVTPAN